ncbi:MAG: class I lanthipeptide [Bacteroidetes bacterium]|nr:class I lanthipeptide [Bacteroidota bacterium]
MKKSFNKLNLNKSTISNLSAIEMNQKNGGIKKTMNTVCCGNYTRITQCVSKTCPTK